MTTALALHAWLLFIVTIININITSIIMRTACREEGDGVDAKTRTHNNAMMMMMLMMLMTAIMATMIASNSVMMVMMAMTMSTAIVRCHCICRVFTQATPDETPGPKAT